MERTRCPRAGRTGDGKLRRALIAGYAESEFIGEIDRLGDTPVVHPAVFSKDVISGDKSLVAGE